MPKYCCGGFGRHAIVVQARSESTAEGVQSVPFNASAFECWLDVLGPKRRQVEWEDTRTPKDPCCVRIVFPMLLQFGNAFGNDVRQEMDGGLPVLSLRVDDFLVPHCTPDV